MPRLLLSLRAFAGAFLLVLIGSVEASAEKIGKTDQERGSQFVDMRSVESQIAQAKAALRLTPTKERYWPRVAATLRAIARQSEKTHRSVASSSQAAAAVRVLSAAAPLIKTLDAGQKQAALNLIRAMGYGHLVSRL